MKNITKIIRQYTAIGLSIALIFLYSLAPIALAQEETQTEVTNEATTTTTTDTTANTGDNTIGEPSPTPTEEVAQEETQTETQTETPTPDPTPPEEDGTITATNSAEVVNEATSSADTGNNEITITGESSDSSETSENHEENPPEPTPAAAIDSGDAAAITTVDNSVNTTEINSQVVYQTINLFVDQNGNIDLSDPAALVQLITTQYPDEAVLNVALTSVTNTATVDNTVTSSANTGNNQINQPEGNGEITTGDAYSLIAILNRINFVMIDSVLHIVTINIFGNFTGNIILPENTSAAGEPCPDCDTSTAIDNGASVTNSIDSQATSGNNTIVATDSASITTGNAVSIVQLTNFINTNLIGAGLFRLFILPFGAWNGSFLGWGDISGQNGGGPLTIGCPECTGDVAIGNQASLTNSISSTANSGGNTINATNGTIQTGRAISLVSLINLVNTSLIRSSGFFGFINIFGNWVGDIGGESFFVEEESAPTEQLTNDTEQVRESGGLLEVTQTNNVGAFVYPGDTVTFFVKVKNPGTGKVYGATLDLLLYQDGINRGGAHFSLGDIEAGKGKKITTGLVLSEQTPPGLYTAVATVRGTTGPENTEVFAQATSQFTVFGSTVLGTTEELIETPELPNVLGAVANKNNTPNILLALLILVLLIPVYKAAKILEDPSLIRAVFAPGQSWVYRFRAAMTLLL